MSPTATTSCGSRTKRSASRLTWTRPLSCMPMSTKQPKSTTFSTVPVSSMPGARSSSLMMPRLKTGAGRSSRGSRPGRANCARMSLSVSTPTSNSLASASDVDRGDALGQRGGRLLLASDRPARRRSRSSTRLAAVIAFRMDPGGVQRVVAGGDFQEAGRLDEGRLAEAGHLAKLLAGAERAVLAPMLVQPPGRQLIQARKRSAAGPGWPCSRPRPRSSRTIRPRRPATSAGAWP